MKGRVTLRGIPPPEKEIPLDSPCARLETNRVTTRHYLVASNGGLANAVVFVQTGLTQKKFAVPAEPFTIRFERCQIQPYVSAARVGQTIRFVNTDNVLHSAFANPRNNRAVGIVAPVVGEDTKRVFEREEIFIRHKCDVHPWEYTYLSVFDHPFFAVTDTNGNFALPAGLPDGAYMIEARHLKAGVLTVAVQVGNGSAHIPDFVFDAPSTAAR